MQNAAPTDMDACYIETSALLAWLGGESKSSIVNTALNSNNRICTSRLSFIESERCLFRARANRQIKEADLKKRQGWLAIFENEWDVLEIGIEVQKAARMRFPIEPVRTLDAIHLASALQFQIVYSPLKVLTFDDRMIENLEPLGLRAWEVR
jgi:predicted nucleic acid-binding protein